MSAVGSCSCLMLMALLELLLLLLSGNGAVQSKAIGKVTTEELSNEVLTSSTEFSTGATTEQTVSRTTTDDVPTINREHVTLRLPDELFSSTANLTLRLRDFLGQLLLRSVARMAQLMRFIQPLFGGHLMIEIPKDLDQI